MSEIIKIHHASFVYVYLTATKDPQLALHHFLVQLRKYKIKDLKLGPEYPGYEFARTLPLDNWSYTILDSTPFQETKAILNHYFERMVCKCGIDMKRPSFYLHQRRWCGSIPKLVSPRKPRETPYAKRKRWEIWKTQFDKHLY
jgi:hypothetical protein